MHLEAVTGDIVVEAPRLAEAAVLWIKTGWNRRDLTWRAMRDAAQPLEVVHGPGGDDCTRANCDTVFAVGGLGLTRLLYVYGNPGDARGVGSLIEVASHVVRALDELSMRGARSVAFMLIPGNPGGDWPTRESNDRSAATMLGAMCAWDRMNPGKIDNAYLVDLQGDFSRVLP